MLQFKNRTRLEGTFFLTPDPHGIDSVYAVVKGTFGIGDTVRLADEQVAPVLAEKFYGDPGTTSISTPSDFSLVKPATDVLLMGTARAPGGRPVTHMDVSLAVGSLRKTVRVIGDRVWESRPLGASMSDPAPFTEMPLVWERAYGGADMTKKGPTAEVRNPVGAGYRVSNGQTAVDGLRLPNLEDPRSLISSPRHSPAPACFAPIAAHWEPRRSFAGTYDDAWQQRRAPYLPLDFDPRFFQLAPPGLTAAGYLEGGEAVEVRGVTESGVLRFTLPRLHVEVKYLLDNDWQPRPANLDTVVIEPDASRVILVWRSVLRCDKKALRVREVVPKVRRVA
jgi:hypothetical protein